MLTKPIMAIILQYMSIKPSCYTLHTYTVIYVNYFSIKLEKKNKKQRDLTLRPVTPGNYFNSLCFRNDDNIFIGRS